MAGCTLSIMRSGLIHGSFPAINVWLYGLFLYEAFMFFNSDVKSP